jgi:hypothetical protein
MFRCHLLQYKNYFCVKKKGKYIDVIIKYIGIVFTQRARNKTKKEKKICQEKKKSLK